MLARSGIQSLDVAILFPVAQKFLEPVNFVESRFKGHIGSIFIRSPRAELQLGSHRRKRSFHEPGAGVRAGSAVASRDENNESQEDGQPAGLHSHTFTRGELITLMPM